jgi:hypothetical protein
MTVFFILCFRKKTGKTVLVQIDFYNITDCWV